MGAKIAGHNNTIQNVDFTGNTYVGFNGGGRGNVITASTFGNIGGYTREAYAIGINTPGTDCVIQANLFRNIYRQPRVPSSQAGEGVGVLIGADQTGCTISHNFFKNDSPGHPVHTDVAAWVAVGASAKFRHNTIIGFPRGLIAKSDQMSAENNLILLPFEGRNAYAIFPPSEQTARNVIIGYDAPPAKKPVTSPN